MLGHNGTTDAANLQACDSVTSRFSVKRTHASTGAAEQSPRPASLERCQEFAAKATTKDPKVPIDCIPVDYQLQPCVCYACLSETLLFVTTQEQAPYLLCCQLFPSRLVTHNRVKMPGLALTLHLVLTMHATVHETDNDNDACAGRTSAECAVSLEPSNPGGPGIKVPLVDAFIHKKHPLWYFKQVYLVMAWVGPLQDGNINVQVRLPLTCITSHRLSHVCAGVSIKAVPMIGPAKYGASCILNLGQTLLAATEVLGPSACLKHEAIRFADMSMQHAYCAYSRKVLTAMPLFAAEIDPSLCHAGADARQGHVQCPLCRYSSLNARLRLHGHVHVMVAAQA